MENLHFYIVFIAGIIPLITGWVWYNPNVFGTAWMNATGITPGTNKGAHMARVFVLTYVFSCLLAFGLAPIVIHQFGFSSMMLGVPGIQDQSTEIGKTFKSIMDTYGNNFRTFKHGALHGAITGIVIAFPILAVNAMFERKKAKYILIHFGYWTVTLALMGGVICGFL